MSTITCRVETIRPHQAVMILEKAQPNRKVQNSQVNMIRRDIEKGRWVLNGESIVIDSDGNLMQGQHRLLACVRAGKSIKSVVVRGIPPSAMASFDQGRKRSLANVLHMQGVAHYAVVSAGANMLHTWLNRPETSSRFAERTSSGTREEVLEFLNSKRPGVRKIVLDELLRGTLSVNNEMSTIMYGSIVLAFHALFAERTYEILVDRFFSRLCKGDMLPDRHPILQLRNLSLNRMAHDKLSRSEQVWGVVLAWNWTFDRTEGDLPRSVQRIMTQQDSPPDVYWPVVGEIALAEELLKVSSTDEVVALEA